MHMHAATPPVLLVVFNRPEQTRLTIEALLRERPARVYVSGDGPRAHVPTDAEQVAAVWAVIAAAPWQCEVVTNPFPENLGLARAVRGGLDWFFAAEERGVIVEDDVELGVGALALAAHLLDDGARDRRIGSISLFNTIGLDHVSEPAASYRRSMFSSSQGWGTYASAWQASPRTLRDWREWLPVAHLRALGGWAFASRWSDILDSDAHEQSATWDFTWQAALWAAGLDTLVANRNLVRNSGFTETATFSFGEPDWWPTAFEQWAEPLVRPTSPARDARADAWEGRQRYGVSSSAALRSSLARRVPGLASAYRARRYGA
ncbi:MAG: hypothetical protein PHU75_07655 [Candidatus Nanopelagicales bacterium]|nr:hypothetical protein [Candidatus Nanopelagicales bacterium]